MAAGALGVLPWTHLDDEQLMLQQEAAAAAAAAPPIVVARVSVKPRPRVAAASGRGQIGGFAFVAVAAAALVLTLAALGGGSEPSSLSPSSSSSLAVGHLRDAPASALPPPPPPVLPPLPGNAPNCFSGGGECARGLMLPLPVLLPPRDAAGAPPPSRPSSSPPAASLLDLVPKVVHLTVEDRGRVPCHMFPTMRSWAELNPGWRVWVWDARDRERLISEAFPRWTAFFGALAHGVERADLFKYAVLSEIGGIYADIDAECRVPIDAWPEIYAEALLKRGGGSGGAGAGGGDNDKNSSRSIGSRKVGGSSQSSSSSSPPAPETKPQQQQQQQQQPPSSALILGIEAMHDDADTYVWAKHVYPLQLAAWTLLSSPGHPALGARGDALFPASQAESARELLALFSEEEGEGRLRVLGALGVRGGGRGAGGGGGDFDEEEQDEEQDKARGKKAAAAAAASLNAAARLWYRESILNRTGPFLLTREALLFASERLTPPLRVDTHEDAARLLRNEGGFVGVAAAAAASSSSSSSPSFSTSSSRGAAVAILPLDAFGSGQPHSRAGPADGDRALVVHRFLSSWRGSGDGQDDGYWCEWKG